MNNLCVDVGWISLNKHGEELCGDHVEVAVNGGEKVVVLSDGLGSGVKANILSMLTSTILSTMLVNKMPVIECVKAVGSTLPVCSERKVAYATFAAARITDNNVVHLIQYDNPRVILFRGATAIPYESNDIKVDDKNISISKLELRRRDWLLLTSDGTLNASPGLILNNDWDIDAIANYMEAIYHPDYTAKELCTFLIDKCRDMYGGIPADDMTACIIKLRERVQVNMLIGPPANPNDDKRAMGLFFSKSGKHIVCGGTTSKVAAEYLGKPVIPNGDIIDIDIPPISTVEGVDLVTEGAITLKYALDNVKDYANNNEKYFDWCIKKDGASLLTRVLLQEATDITIFAGGAKNHGNDLLFADCNEKEKMIEELRDTLIKIGKQVKLIRF